MRTPLLYALHSGNLYGTERMALATAAGLADEFAPVIFAPEGPALAEARRRGFEARAFRNIREFARLVRPWLAGHKRLAFVATGVTHSGACLLLNLFYRRKVAHLHLVHGGAEERLSYGRKRMLNGRPVTFVAVSSFVRERLIANGVATAQIEVVENFLPEERVAAAPRRAPFTRPGIGRVIVISRLDPMKRVDLLLEALERSPVLRRLPVRIFGTGWEQEMLKYRAAKSLPCVEFAGFRPDLEGELAGADLLAHMCPVEPFGLAILEAMAADIPVLVPDRGGAGSLVEHDISGFRFSADDADSLAARLEELTRMPAGRLNRVVAGGRCLLATRFSQAARIADYRRLLEEAAA
ncbi:MAG TPA: glycosyltransferase family 4 protein [Bryobacteraceae bacterium]|nr:glycosyltransferase family 4 protein [Bryobacteraceae bacterium]